MKFKKVALIVPPNNYISKDYLPPLGVLYLASYLEDKGVKVKVIDMPSLKLKYKDIPKEVEGYDLVGITGVTNTRLNTLRLVRILKDKKIVLGGVHFTYAAKVTLNSCPNVLAIVRFEGEEILHQICRGDPFKSIAGITYRNEFLSIVENPDGGNIDIKKTPWPARHLIDMNNYTAKLEGENITHCTSILTSRGCPYNCAFCANSTYWKRKVRYRDPIDVVDEIEFVLKKYKIKGFDIWDDTFTVSKKHVTTICNEIIKRKLKIKFYARIRANTTKEEILELMKRAGCVAVSFGVESGSPKVLKSIYKQIKIKEVFELSRLIKKHGLVGKAFFMFNHPKENYFDLIKTFYLMRKLRRRYDIATPVALNSYVFPGTDLEADMIKRKKMPKNFNWNQKFKNVWSSYTGEENLLYKNLNFFMILILGFIYSKIIFKIMDLFNID